MRFIHTADWHLGRLFYGVHLTEDQAQVIDQFVQLTAEVRPDAVLIAGDVYDRAVPPTEAVELLDDTLCRLVLGCKVPVIMIGGNHDSPQRLSFGSRLLAGEGLHVFGSPSTPTGCVSLPDRAGPVRVCALPYCEPSVVRSCLGGDDIHDHNTAMRFLCRSIRQESPGGHERVVVVAHAFVAGGQESESERPLSVGGTGAVDARPFDGFNYVALGHLHRPQSSAADAARYSYSGSLLKYSFAEAAQDKSVSLVDMDGAGQCTIERITLSPRRDVRCVEGYLDAVLQGPGDGQSREDYLLVRLLDKGAILDAMGKLRQVYPNVLHIERPGLGAGGEPGAGPADHRKLNDQELFGSFFREATGEELTDDQRRVYAKVVNQMRRRDREAQA